MARACISTISGKLTNSREPRWPSIGLNSRKTATLRLSRFELTSMAAATSPMAASPWGRNSCKRRIEQADGHRQAGHDLEQLDEILPLHGQQLGQRPAAALLVIGQDHLAHGDDAALVEEHMLGAAEPDAVGAEGARLAGVGRRVGIGAHPHAADLVGPAHQRGEVRRRGRARASARGP